MQVLRENNNNKEIVFGFSSNSTIELGNANFCSFGLCFELFVQKKSYSQIYLQPTLHILHKIPSLDICISKSCTFVAYD